MKYKIEPLTISHLDDAAALAFAGYEAERQAVPALPELSREFFAARLAPLIAEGAGFAGYEAGGFAGYLVFGKPWEDGGLRRAASPLYGYGVAGSDRRRLHGLLFQHAAGALAENMVGKLYINTYAHDVDALYTYTMSAFEMSTTCVIRDTAEPVGATISGYEFRELDSAELIAFKDDITELYRDLINHLRKSPVFYPCHEFLPLEERFGDYLGGDIRVFAALRGGELVGMVNSAPTDIEYLRDVPALLDVGDLFVKPAYREAGLGRALLTFANDCLKKDGVRRLTVTHGTVNPTARGFWDRYFNNYAYDMQRVIEPEMLGKIKLF